MPRPTWDEHFLELIDVMGKRATCDRGRSGCVIVKDRRMVSGGYVGSPPGMDHCDDVGHKMFEVIDDDGVHRQHCVRTVHAEQNAILQAARFGISLIDTTLYCKMEPCRVCAMFIATVGIKRVVARRLYQAGAEGRAILKACGVEVVVWEDKLETYGGQNP